jgi:hypothetical protein
MDSSRLLAAVLALPPDDRMSLALRVLESIDDDDSLGASDTAWDAAWEAEIDERIADAPPGPLFEELIAELRAKRG